MATPDGSGASSCSFRPLRGSVLSGDELPSLLHAELETPTLEVRACAPGDRAAKRTKRKRQLLGAMLGVHDGPDACALALAASEDEQVVQLEAEARVAAVEDADVSEVASDLPHRVSSSPATSSQAADRPSAPDASMSLVIQKKCRRQAIEASGSPDFKCWSAEERVVVGEDVPVLRRSASTLGTRVSEPKRPSLERRQLSAAAIDAASTVVHELVLPTIQSMDHPDLNVISPETVRRVLAGEFRDRLASFELIDCRFPYEHRGGSLRGSRSLADPASVEEAFMARPSPECTRVALIFFCEFSANRAPKMARHMRNLDRWIHADCYPELFYPELYLIDGGYKNCFEQFKGAMCEPPTYVRMNDAKFTDACRSEFSTWRRRWKAHKMVNCVKQFQRPNKPPAAPIANAKPPARPVRSLVDQL